MTEEMDTSEGILGENTSTYTCHIAFGSVSRMIHPPTGQIMINLSPMYSDLFRWTNSDKIRSARTPYFRETGDIKLIACFTSNIETLVLHIMDKTSQTDN